MLQEMHRQIAAQNVQIQQQAQQLKQQQGAGQTLALDIAEERAPRDAAVQRETDTRLQAEELVRKAREEAEKAKTERDEARASGGIVDTQ